MIRPVRILLSLFFLLTTIATFAQTKVVNSTYSYDGKKYPLQMEVTDWKAVFNQNKTATLPAATGAGATTTYYRPSRGARRLHKSIERMGKYLQAAEDKAKYIKAQLEEVKALYKAGDYEMAYGLLQTKELRAAAYSNDQYTLLNFLTSARLSMTDRAYSGYISGFCYTVLDAGGSNKMAKSYMLDDPGTGVARNVQDRYSLEEWYEVELAFSAVLVNKHTNAAYNNYFLKETALEHLNKTLTFFEKKGFVTTTNPYIILLYERCGDSAKSNRLFKSIIDGLGTNNSARYQLCSYIIGNAEPGSKVLNSAAETMTALHKAAKNNDEKILTGMQLMKVSYALDRISEAMSYALELSVLLPLRSNDYISVTYLIGQIEQNRGDYPAAIVHYDYVIFFSTDVELKKSALSEKAACFINSGDKKNALLIYRQLHTEYPDKFTLNECISFYIAHQDYQLAETLLQQSLKEDPLFYMSLLNYGNLMVATGKAKKARDYYVKAANQGADLSETQRKNIADYK